MEIISNFAVFKTLKIFLIAEDHFMHNIKDKLISMHIECLMYTFHQEFCKSLFDTKNKTISVL
jgi:hypothetical protein